MPLRFEDAFLNFTSLPSCLGNLQKETIYWIKILVFVSRPFCNSKHFLSQLDEYDRTSFIWNPTTFCCLDVKEVVLCHKIGKDCPLFLRQFKRVPSFLTTMFVILRIDDTADNFSTVRNPKIGSAPEPLVQQNDLANNVCSRPRFYAECQRKRSNQKWSDFHSSPSFRRLQISRLFAATVLKSCVPGHVAPRPTPTGWRHNPSLGRTIQLPDYSINVLFAGLSARFSHNIARPTSIWLQRNT